ncbi:MAG: protein-methionine-sulfoxide reductase heme-binding subunit MsrQ [Dehalococcoidales bacterium]
MYRLKKDWFRLAAHIAALLPLALLIWDFTQDQLTVNPIQAIQLRTGRYALVLLVITLASTPISRLFGSRQLLALRRPLGLYTFMYASLHFLNFLVIDYRFDFDLIREDLFEKRFALAGFAAFLCLLPLAITSTRGWIVRLGKRWGNLHRLIYPAAVLAVIHFVWQVKADIREPLVFGVIVLLLLLVRLPVIRDQLVRIRDRLRSGGEDVR